MHVIDARAQAAKVRDAPTLLPITQFEINCPMAAFDDYYLETQTALHNVTACKKTQP